MRLNQSRAEKPNALELAANQNHPIHYWDRRHIPDHYSRFLEFQSKTGTVKREG